MSVSKYRYEESCDGQPCPWDCDLCGKEDDMDDIISRRAAIDAIKKIPIYVTLDFGETCGKMPVVSPEAALYAIQRLPSAQPEPHYDEWCTDCKEYDKERHCCPRWNRVIRQTLKDAQPERKTGKWIKLYTGNYKCSVCGDWWGNDDNGMIEDFNFCPNCGSDMR